MAKPEREIVVWASQDVNLPGTGKPNKSKPIDDLLAKGYDKGQKPAAEEWNYMWNVTTDWLRYVTYEQIPGLDERYLQKTLNLSDIPDKSAARNNLGIMSREESEAAYVNVSGDTMTGGLSLPRLNFTKVDSTDYTYIEASTLANDRTVLDFVIGDNSASGADGRVDSMRFRFSPPSGMVTTMMELWSLDEVNSYLKVFGNIWGKNLELEGALSWQGIANGYALNLNRLNASTVESTQVNSGSVSTSSANIGTTTTDFLSVNTQSATVSGRNVVRSVNGNTADGNGDLSLEVITTEAEFFEDGGNGYYGESGGWWRDKSTGLIEQWGIAVFDKPSSESEYIPFHMTFPNYCQNIQLCNFENFKNEGNTWRVKTKTAGGFTMSNGGGNMYTSYMWRAIGK